MRASLATFWTMGREAMPQPSGTMSVEMHRNQETGEMALDMSFTLGRPDRPLHVAVHTWSSGSDSLQESQAIVAERAAKALTEFAAKLRTELEQFKKAPRS